MLSLVFNFVCLCCRSFVVVAFIVVHVVAIVQCNYNRPLLTPKVEEGDLLSKQREDSLVARLKMFIHLRQDLERVRNLCYMVTRREKMRCTLDKLRRELFAQQLASLRALRPGTAEYLSVVEVNVMLFKAVITSVA